MKAIINRQTNEVVSSELDDTMVEYLRVEKKWDLESKYEVIDESLLDKVSFHKFADGEVIALFPNIEWDMQGNITSYMHIGQHGSASPDLLTELEKATPDEFQELLRELERIGYKLKVLN